MFLFVFLILALPLALPISEAQAEGPNERVIYSFTGFGPVHPYYGLTRDHTGALYGTASSYQGSIFRVSPSRAFNTLYSFTGGKDGGGPSGVLLVDKRGNIYGTTGVGGTINDNCPLGCGTVYTLSADGNLTVLYSFTGGADGGKPGGGLVRDEQDNLYGSASQGGAIRNLCPDGCGVIFKVTREGAESVIYTFLGPKFGDGSFPESGLTIDKQGNLYGTTFNGGSLDCNCGTVFKVAPDGTETVLHSFNGVDGNQLDWQSLALDEDGNLYGATLSGGIYGWGVAYKIAPDGTEIVLHNFTGGSDGGGPYGGLIRDDTGNLYGTALCVDCTNGLPGTGLVFQLSPDGTETVLYTFQGGDDGAITYAGLIPGKHDSFYGVTYFGGNTDCLSGCGTIYQVRK